MRTNEFDFGDLDDVVRVPVESILRHPLPDAEMQATLSRIAALADAPPDRRVPGSVLRTWGHNMLVGIPLVAIALLCFFLMLGNSATSVAQQTADSLWTQNWIRVVELENTNHRSETWFSFRDDVSARDDGESIEFRNHRSAEFQYFSKTERTVYLVSEHNPPRRYDSIAELVASVPLLLTESGLSNPVEDISLLRELGNRVEFKNQLVDRLDDGQIEYLVGLTYEFQPAELVLQIDGTSHLPSRCDFRLTKEDESLTRTFLFEYHDEGPEDIYSMGVPRDSSVVDRVERDSVRFLTSAIRAGSLSFDDYQALVIRYRPEDPIWWINAHKERVTRHNTQWERRSIYVNFYPEFEKVTQAEAMRQIRESGPAEGTDWGTWWDEQLAMSEAPEGQPLDAVEGFSNARTRWSLLPEFMARPPIGGPGINHAVQVEEDSEVDLGGLVFLKLVRTGFHRATQEEQLHMAAAPHEYRYWIDPEKGYLISRLEFLDASGDVIQTSVVEESAQSPTGQWYPVRMRLESKQPDGKFEVEVLDVYMTFPE